MPCHSPRQIPSWLFVPSLATSVSVFVSAHPLRQNKAAQAMASITLVLIVFLFFIVSCVFVSYHLRGLTSPNSFFTPCNQGKETPNLRAIETPVSPFLRASST